MTADIVDLAARRTPPKMVVPKHEIDADCQMIDHHGNQLFLFGVSWQFEGSEWNSQIWAKDQTDAEARVTAMRDTAQVAGVVCSQGDAPWFEARPSDDDPA